MPPKRKTKPKKKVTQKQKQKQSQKIVINLASPKRRTTKPRASATPQSARVLSQFVMPEQVLPDRRTMINPIIMPEPFSVQTRSAPAINRFAPRPEPVREGRILGRAPPEIPLEVSNVLKSVGDVDALLSGKKEPDTPVTEGRQLLPSRMWTGRAVSDAGISSLSDTEPEEPFRQPRFRRGSSTEATMPLGRVEEETDEEFFGGGGGPSPSLMRR
jgi:hypothetical protein